MRLLIVTQKIDQNDNVLGFFHRWVEEFSQHCEQIIVICLQAGSYSLPSNVRVLSLGKEDGVRKLKYLWRFYQYIIQERKNYNAVFVHMNQIYVVLGGVLWRLWHKKIALWYTHKQVGLLLYLAEKLVNNIFTASVQSFNLKSKKLVITGHGIDTGEFHCLNREIKIDSYRILTVGRITRIKNLETLIQATGLLVGKIENLQVDIVGSPITAEDKKYQEELLALVKEKNLVGVVRFLGPRPYIAMPEVYCAYDCLINLAPTGGVDKAVLEAMSCELPVLVANRSFDLIFGAQRDLFLFEFGQTEDLAKKILALYNLSAEEYEAMGKYLREQVMAGHDLKKTIPKIIAEICPE